MRFENPEPKNNSQKISFSDKVMVVSALAAAGAAPAGLKLADAYEKYHTETHEYIKEGVLDLGEALNAKFKTGLQVESESGQYILHIAQLHGEGNATPEQRDKAVAYQKDLEKLILELKSRYGLTVFLHENRTIDDPDESTLNEGFEIAFETYEEKGLDFYLENAFRPNMEIFARHINNFDPEKRNNQNDRREDAELYQMLNWFEKFFQALSEKELSKEDRVLCAGALDRVLELKKTAKDKPNFLDQSYLDMGATELLARSGEIVEFPAESEASRANRPKTRFQTFGIGAEFHERRENFSAGLAYDYAQHTQDSYIPMVYGYGHDFTNNVEMINAAQTDPDKTIGLIRIDYKDGIK